MDREYEFNIEKTKLLEVIKILNIETLDYIAKRKYITEYITEYRKKEREENKFDEDEQIKFFDHESYVKEEAYKIIDKRLKEISILKDSPYFGKIVFEEDDDNYYEFYIGRFGLTKRNGYEPIIIDWRAPVSALFYKGTLGHCKYSSPKGDVDANVVSRRQIVIKKGELKGIFDSAIDVKDSILQMVLSENSSPNLKDIVMTIQKEQDEIIRENENKVVVVNGVAGSGKTTIALHRVSYLLYNFRKKFKDKVLIFGPNDIFMDYISEVLPSLGESNVIEQTFESFAMKEIGLDNIDKKLSYYVEEILNGNKELKKEYSYKNSFDFISFLDSQIKELNNNYFKVQDVEFFGEIIVTSSEIIELFNKYYVNMPLFRRSEKIKRILISRIKDKRDEYVRILIKELQDSQEGLSEEEVEIQKNDIEFRRNIRIREIVREVMNAREKLDSWLGKVNIKQLYKDITRTEEIGYIDLAGILYLMIKLQGKKSKTEIKHIVMDEAQDYSMIQFKVIRELTSCNSFTIVGDKNQRLIKYEEEPAMLKLDELFGENNVNYYNLNKSYRSTRQIMEYASSFLDTDLVVPLVREGDEVIVEETTDKEDIVETIISLIEDYEEDGLESIGVIVKDSKMLHKVSDILKGRTKILTFDREELIYKGGRVLIPSYYAKGLEFDGVIIVSDKNSETDNLINYIMCTRALHRLSVVE